MSQSPGDAMSDDGSDFYADDGQVEGHVQQDHQDTVALHQYAPVSPASDAMQMDESPPSSPERVTIKRKLSPDLLDHGFVQKRQKVHMSLEKYFSTAVPSTAGLPAEAWQHIFLHLTPDSLSCCLRVNKAFNSYLTSTSAALAARLPPRRTGIKLLDGEAIWTSSRKQFALSLPRPLAGFSEMGMIQLLGGKYCQICDSPPKGPVTARTPFDAGPGPTGVRIIWSFSARMCGKCFEGTSIKDTEILQSSASPLRAGLSHAFRTNDMHYIPATTLAANPSGAPRGAMFKVYYRKHIDDLQGEHEDAKEFGEAAAEEWIKGLPLNGKQQMADAARWERWEALHPPGTHPAKILREYFRPISALPAQVSEPTNVVAAAPLAVSASVQTPSSSSSLPVLSSQPMKHPLPARVVAATPTSPSAVHSSQNGVPSLHGLPPHTAPPLHNGLPSHNYQSAQPSLPAHDGQPSQNGLPPNGAPPTHSTLPQQQQQTLPQPQQDQQNKPLVPAYRPPRNPKEVEEARMSRKADIERRCMEEFFPPLMPNVLQHMESFRAAMIIVTPLTDQAWEVLKPRLYMQRDAAEQIEYQRGEQLRALQATIPDPSYRDTYSKSANEAAERQWEQQQGPVRKKLGKFADEFIRGKWNNGKGLSRDTAPPFAVEVLLYARGKHVEKNTPTDQQNKEGPRNPSDPAFVSLENMRWLFDNKVKPLTEKHCRELFMCAECESVTKGYAFEGMIQHFGAKHTSDFSQGNIVVHWQTADWPDDPPFVPTVGEADPTLPEKQPASAAASHAVQYGSYGYPPQQQSTGYAPHVGLPNFAPGQLEQLFATLNNGQQSATPPAAAHHTNSHHPQTYEPEKPHSAPSYQQYAATAPLAIPQFGTPVNVYQDQLDEVAKVAREVWECTAGVKDLQESVRVQAMLHQVIVRFKARFSNVPSLDLITDALSKHELMRPIKNAHPLACKTCISSTLGSTAYKPYQHRLADNKTYNISSLITHFKTVHLIGQDAGTVDWKEDMIEMADEEQIKQLISTVGMDDEKLFIVAQAFPDMFPYPLPRIGKIESKSDNSPLRLGGNFNKPSKKDRKKKNSKRGRQMMNDQDDADQSDLPEAGEDEYDPRRPAFINAPGQGRSGRRSLVTGNGNATVPPPAIDPAMFTPETLAALSKIAPTLNLGAPRGRRSPSTSRATNEAAFRTNQRAAYHPDDPAANHNAHQQEKEKPHGKRDRSGRNRRSAAGVSGGEAEPEEDYTQIIRTAPANNGDYSTTSLAQHPGVVPAVSPRQYAAERARARSQHPEAAPYERVAVDQYGRPVPVSEPYRYEERERVQYVDEYGRPIQYAPPPREEVRYVDQYGRPVEVVRVVERPAYDRPMYDYPPQGHEYAVPPPHGQEYARPEHEYGAPPSGREYIVPPPQGPEYGRQPDAPYARGPPPERVQYVDEYGRPIQYPY